MKEYLNLTIPNYIKEYLNLTIPNYIKEINSFNKEIYKMDRNIKILDKGNLIDHFEKLYYYINETLNSTGLKEIYDF